MCSLASRTLTSVKDTILIALTAGNITTKHDHAIQQDVIDSQDGHVAAPLITGSVAACVMAVIVSYFIRPEALSIVSVQCVLLVVIIGGVVVMVCIGIAFRHGRLTTDTGRDNERHVTHKEERYESLYFWLTIGCLVVFGSLSLGSNFLYIMRSLECIALGGTQGKIDMAYNIIQSVFLLSHIIFLCSFGRTRFNQSAALQYGLKAIVLADFCIWFLIVISEGPGIFSANTMKNTTLGGWFDSGSDCFYNSSAHEKIEIAEPFLSPFIVEFTLLGAGLILEMETSVNTDQTTPKNVASQTERKMVPNGPEVTHHQQTDVNRDGPITETHTSMNCSGGYFSLTLLVALLICGGLLMLSLFIPKDQNDSGYESIMNVYTWYYTLGALD